MSQTRPRVAFLMPGGPRRGQVFSPSALERLNSFAEVLDLGQAGGVAVERLPAVLPEVDACLTGWGSPPLTVELLEQAPRLKVIAHSAGSIKHLVPLAAFERGVVVCHAADLIAEAVAECTILFILLGLRQYHRIDRAMKAGVPWSAVQEIHFGNSLADKTVGLVGCGYVARRVIGLLKPFGAQILVYDPYLSDAQAAALGVSRVPLDDLMARSEIVSNHAPITPETRHMIGARQLALLRDGAVFANTARAWAIDMDALTRELQTGRFWALLDVFEPEPLPLDSPLRQLDNVFLTPHRAGGTVETYAKLGAAMVDELERFFSGQPLRYSIPREKYAIMA